MDRSLTTKIIMAVLALFFILMLVFQFTARSEHYVKTEVAMRYDSLETIEFDGVFIRNEHLVNKQVNGVIRYEHPDGSKLGINSVIANVYSSASDVEICREIDNLNARIETLKDAQSLAGTDNSQIEAFNKLITEKHSELVKAVDSGDYSAASDIKYQLLNLHSKRDMAKGKTVDYSSVIASLEKKITSLQSRISTEPSAILSEETGYFVSSIDGYESELKFADAEKITPETIEKVIAVPSKAQSGGTVIGKMIEDYKWKIAAVLDDTSAAALTESSKVRLVAGSGPEQLTAYVEAVERYGGKNVVVFSADELQSGLSSRRTERFKLLIDSYNGIRISAQAIHFDDENNIGVFIKSGVECKFRKIKKIYSGDGYVIAEDTTDSTGYLSLYDNIIVEGKDLYDGKIL